MNDHDAAKIYAAYPRKIGKLDAFKAIRQAAKLLRKDERFAGADLSCIVEFLRRRWTARTSSSSRIAAHG